MPVLEGDRPCAPFRHGALVLESSSSPASLSAGEPLSASLPERYFTRSLSAGLMQFEDTPAERLQELFAAVQTNLRSEVGWYAERAVRWTRWFYSLLIFSLLLLMVRGFLLPIYSLSVR